MNTFQILLSYFSRESDIILKKNIRFKKIIIIIVIFSTYIIVIIVNIYCMYIFNIKYNHCGSEQTVYTFYYFYYSRNELLR